MKVQIVEIIRDNLTEDAADEIEQLMCNREVSGMIRMATNYIGSDHYWVLQLLKGDYPESVINKAIDQYKATIK
jgi:hypothetical protein